MSCITRNGGFYIVRLEKSADPLIVGVHRNWRGRAVDLVGKRVSEVLRRLKRQQIDVEVEVRFKKRRYGGICRSATMRLRWVGVRDVQSGGHHLCLTNIAPRRLSANEIAQVYAVRWIIELLFRQLKSQFRVQDLPLPQSRDRRGAGVRSVDRARRQSRTDGDHQGAAGEAGERVAKERWSKLFSEAARDLLRCFARRASVLTRALLADVAHVLLHEAVDPSAGRLMLLRRVETLTQCSLRYC
jgi:hypothetical protein